MLYIYIYVCACVCVKWCDIWNGGFLKWGIPKTMRFDTKSWSNDLDYLEGFDTKSWSNDLDDLGVSPF